MFVIGFDVVELLKCNVFESDLKGKQTFHKYNWCNE